MPAALPTPHRRLACRAFVLLASALPAAASSDARVDYLVRIDDPASARVTMEAHFTGLAPRRGRLELAMVEQYAFARLPAPRIDAEPRARGPSGEELEISRTSPYAWTVVKGGLEELALSWSIRLDHRAQPEVGTR